MKKRAKRRNIGSEGEDTTEKGEDMKFQKQEKWAWELNREETINWKIGMKRRENHTKKIIKKI